MDFFIIHHNFILLYLNIDSYCIIEELIQNFLAISDSFLLTYSKGPRIGSK